MSELVAQPTIDLLGVRFNSVTEDEVVATILDAVSDGRGGWVSTANIHHLRTLTRSPEHRKLADDASVVVADGMPLIWASRLQGTPLPERVAGSNLVWSLAERAAERDASLFLLGGEDGVATRASAELQDRFPTLRIVGTYCPPMGFEHDRLELARIAEQLEAARPDLVYVGLGFPKQEQLIKRLRPILPDAWFLGIGISLSFISGDQSRAPRWMQLLGLEWLHRLAQEPKRLFRRYVLEGIPFTLVLLARSARPTSLVPGVRRGNG